MCVFVGKFKALHLEIKLMLGVSGRGCVLRGVLHAHLAPGDARQQVAGLDCLLLGLLELVAGLQRDHPEAGHGLVEVARALGAVALDEGRGAEVLQAGARRLQRLSTASITHSRVLREG